MSDRRAALTECCCEHVDDAAYFTKLIADIHTKRVGFKFLNWLAQRDISAFVPGNIPETQLRQDVKARSIPNSLRHIKAICEGSRSWKPKTATVVIKPKEMYADYGFFCASEGLRGVVQKESYEDFMKNHLKLEDKQHGRGKMRERGWKIDYEELDKTFMTLLKRTTSCFNANDDEDDEEDNDDDE
jgi:hypothetical protein